MSEDQDAVKIQTDAVAKAIRRNIEIVAKLEESFKRDRTPAGWLADRITAFMGSPMFVVLHAVVFAVWLTINMGAIPFIPKFDPYPFLLLSVSLSIEAIFLSTFVLIKQNRMSRREELRANLDLQVNLIAEREMTLVLQMLQRISTRLGVRLSGEEIEELSDQISVEALASELRDKLGGE
jgi:uncharacterized membrane protein